MSRILFDNERPAAEADAGRADVALFVGLARRVGSAVPPAVKDWLQAQGWADGAYKRPLAGLLDVPVPVETWAGFTAMFDAGGSEASFGTDYLGAAVRSFFAQGGRRCYVVRMGDPVAPSDDAAARAAALASLLPYTEHRPEDPLSWRGAGHLGGLPDVSYLALPDLPALAASRPSGAAGEEPSTAKGPEQFVECSAADITPPQFRVFDSPAPRLAEADYAAWAAAVGAVLRYLSNSGREVQLVAAMPLPQEPAVLGTPSASSLARDIHSVLDAWFPETPGLTGGLSSAFLQLGYPWLKTTGSHTLLESLEPPDGVLTGLLARNALARGAFTSAVKTPPSEVFDVWPELPAAETRSSAEPLKWGDNSRKPLIERLSLFGNTPSGIRLLSDVTAYPGESYRPARVNRLVAVICRAARRLGEDIVFEANGETLWARVRSSMRQLMTRFWTLNALEGATASEAFTVKCDGGTMTQNDIDNGRLVCMVTFTAAATIEVIRVTLALETSGAGPKAIVAAQEAA